MASAAPPAVHAGGAVVWRRAGSGLEVMLVHRPRYDDWSWPKGKLEPGETLAACAVREVAEETGLPVVLGAPLPGVRYRLSDGRMKVCHYWAARVIAPESAALRARVGTRLPDGTEVDAVAWVTPARARALLTRPTDRAPLDALVDLWDEAALDTRVLVVLRHARAKKRSAWSGGEHDRPLTASGLHQASDAVASLSAFGVECVVTSPWERCLATVAPYALAAGVEPEEVPALTEAAAKRSAAGVRRAVEHLVAAFRTRGSVPGCDGAVLCTHRPVLPAVLTAVAKHAPNRVQAKLPSTNPYLRTGELLVLHVLPRHRRGVRIVAVERHRAHP